MLDVQQETAYWYDSLGNFNQRHCLEALRWWHLLNADITATNAAGLAAAGEDWSAMNQRIVKELDDAKSGGAPSEPVQDHHICAIATNQLTQGDKVRHPVL